MSQSIALITGASSGLGQEYVRQLSRDPKVQEIWAIARRKDRLEALSTLAACPVRAIPLDLTRQESLDTLRDLLARGSRVLEICSTAAFQPMPGLGVYAATKAFLHSYAKTLHHELLPKGIHVTAVCPYWVKDTEFIPLAQEGKAGQFHHFPLASRSKSVVSLSLAASAVNLWVATPGIVCTLHRVAAKFIPHCLMVPLMELFRRL